MSHVVEWLEQRIPHRTDEDGTTYLRWTGRSSHVQETPVDYMVSRFGPTIKDALDADEDVVEAIQSGDFDAAWKDIWVLWRENGWL